MRHIFYLCGFLSFKPKFTSFLLLDCSQNESILFVGESEASKAKGCAVKDVVTFPDYALAERMVAYPDYIATALVKCLPERIGEGKLEDGKLGIEDWHLAFEYTRSLEALGRSISYVGISALLLSMRALA